MKLDTIGTTVGIIGAVFVALGKPFEANAVWLISNPILIIHNNKTNQFSQSRMFFVFTIISLFGVLNLWSE